MGDYSVGGGDDPRWRPAGRWRPCSDRRGDTVKAKPLIRGKDQRHQRSWPVAIEGRGGGGWRWMASGGGGGGRRWRRRRRRWRRRHPFERRLELRPQHARAPESAASIVFTVGLSEGSREPVSVRWRTADRTATSGPDYSAAEGTLTIPAGDRSGRIRVWLQHDRLDEA